MALARVVLPRLAAVLVALGGLALVVLGLQRTAAFGGERPLVGRMPRVQQPIVVTTLGMTELSGAAVRARAASASPSVPVFIGIGRADDVDAYLGDVARVELTGLGPTGVLQITNRTGVASLPDPSGVDVWASCVRAGGVATLTWPRTPGRWRLVVATDGATPPSAVELTWSGTTGMSPVPAMLAIGAVLFVVGTAGLLAIRSGRIFAAAVGPADQDEVPPEAVRPARVRSPGPGEQR